jgi:ADP-ribosylation factor-like protein 2
VWVVDSADRLRIDDCRQELAQLLQEEVNIATWENDPVIALHFSLSSFHQRLAGATLLVFANKQDIPSALTDVQLKEVSSFNRDCSHFTLVILT